MSKFFKLNPFVILLRPPVLMLMAWVIASGIANSLHASSSAGNGVFSGSAAFAATRKATAFGERPAGSAAIGHLRDWIIAELKPLKGQLILDSFTGQTPTGPVPMTNVILKFAGNSGKSVVVTGHYDTLKKPMVHFVGANDGGSSTGFLIEFARIAAAIKHPDDIYIVFFDGEEAVVEWTDADSRYGSKHLASKWAADGTLSKIKALINVDMIGDKELDLANDLNSSEGLRNQVSKIAAKLDDSKYFQTQRGGIDDDHKPFADAGVNVIDIIDLDYGPDNHWWHTADDTMDKLSVHSFQVVGDVVLELVKQLEAQKNGPTRDSRKLFDDDGRRSNGRRGARNKRRSELA